MDYSHQDETVILQYTGGDWCPPGEVEADPFFMQKLVSFLLTF